MNKRIAMAAVLITTALHPEVPVLEQHLLRYGKRIPLLVVMAGIQVVTAPIYLQAAAAVLALSTVMAVMADLLHQLLHNNMD